MRSLAAYTIKFEVFMMPTPIKIVMAKDCEDLFPTKAHTDDAAFDLRSRCDLTLPPMLSTLIPSGVFIELPINFEAQIRPRSGLALKHNITLTNTPGTIDAGYRGEIGIIALNLGQKPFEIKRGDRIAQMVICRLPEVKLVKCDRLGESCRGSGGFGSSGRA
ncbi:MAG: dUTP diphosphatase [Lentisphaeria bacterium]|nr:dUTP diphosphatase [Lentisphaeria bacterium]